MKPNMAEAAAHCRGWFGWAHVYGDGFSVFTVFAMQHELGWGKVRNQQLVSRKSRNFSGAFRVT